MVERTNVMVECVMCGRFLPWDAAIRATLGGITRRVWLCELCYFRCAHLEQKGA